MKIQNNGESASGKSVNRKTHPLIHPFTHSPIHLFTQKGFSLIEIVMIIVVVSIAIPTLLILVGGEAGRGVESELRVTASNVAQKLMEEIRTKNWDHNMPIPPGSSSTTLGPDGEASRGGYNDVDDFNDVDPAAAGCTDTVTVNNVIFTRAVDVCYVKGYTDPPTLNTCLTGVSKAADCTWTYTSSDENNTPTDYKKITVTITAPSTTWNSSVELITVMTNY